MSRQPMEHDLPALPEALGSGPEFRPGQSAVRQLARALEGLARRFRRMGPRPFYSQREVARFFQVPLRTVAVAYRRLAEQRLLLCRRGSGTWIAGRKPGPRGSMRGIIGLPVWLSGFAMFPHWRAFFVQLEEHARRAGFVADFVFFRQNEELGPDFAERLIDHQLDGLVWLFPVPAVRPTLRLIAEAGVPVAAVSERAWSLPAMALYRLDWSPAMGQAFAAWKREGIEQVEIMAGENFPEELKAVRRLAATAGLECVSTPNDATSLTGTARRGLMFLDELAHYWMCRIDPDSMLQLVRTRRVLIKNSLPLPAAPPELRVDAVCVDWAALVRRIVDDFAGGRTSDPAAKAVPTRFHLQAPAREFVGGI